MKYTKFILVLLGAASFQGVLGCATVPRKTIPPKETWVHTVAMMSPVYVGFLGNRERAWRGATYQDCLSLALHCPTGSELVIAVRLYPENPEPTSNFTTKSNVLRAFVESCRVAVNGNEISSRYEIISHNRDYGLNGKSQKDKADYNYLRAEFIGKRMHAEWTSSNEVVHTTMFVTDLDPDFRKPPSGVLLVFIAMVPLDVPIQKREELLKVMGIFQRELLLIRVPPLKLKN